MARQIFLLARVTPLILAFIPFVFQIVISAIF
ncbi:hypothetical protein LINPERPRIM_LOCUS3382 [Linum perenne]